MKCHLELIYTTLNVTVKKITLLSQKETSTDEHLVRRQSMTTVCFQSDLQEFALGQNLIGYLPGKS